jgi:hypothetical protein
VLGVFESRSLGLFTPTEVGIEHEQTSVVAVRTRKLSSALGSNLLAGLLLGEG